MSGEDDDREEYQPILCPTCDGEPSHYGDCATCDNDGWVHAEKSDDK